MIYNVYGYYDLNPLPMEEGKRKKSITFRLESEGIISIKKACDLLEITEYEYKNTYNFCS